MALNLKKVKMPTPEGKDPMFSLDMSGESEPEEGESPEHEAAESPEEEAEEYQEGEETADLNSIPDEDLIEEIKKRGFKVQK